MAGQLRWSEAEAALRSALAADPSQHAWMHALAKALLEQGRRGEALQILDRAIALAPRSEYRFARAACAINLGRNEEAERDLRLVLAERPDDELALVALGKLAASDGRMEEALPLFERCLARNPAHVEARFQVALLDAQAGRLDAAAASFEALLRQDPGHVGAQYNLGRALMRLGRKVEGAKWLAAFQESRKLDAAIEAQGRLVNAAPRDVDARLVLVEMLLGASRTDDAVRHLQAARGFDPDHPEVYELYATLLERTGRGAEAEAVRARARALEAAQR